MARNTSKNKEMQQHPEMAKAMEKATRHVRPVKRALAGFGSGGGDRPRPFPMTDSPAGGGEIIAHAIQLNDDGVNVLPADAVVVCVFRRYAKTPFAGPCKHVIFSQSELSPFDESQYAGRKEKNDEQRANDQKEVPGRSEGESGAEHS